MTLGELVDRVRVYLDDLTGTRVADAAIRASANAVIRDLWIKLKRANPDWAQKKADLTTQAGSDRAALPSDFGTLTRLEHVQDQAPLSPWRWPREAAVAAPGKPWEFRIEKDAVVFRTTPDAAYGITLWYERIIPALSSDSDVHGLPEFFDELIVSRTALRLGVKGLSADLVFLEERNLLSEMSRSRTDVLGYWEDRAER